MTRYKGHHLFLINRQACWLIFICVAILLLSRCFAPAAKQPADIRGPGYAGSGACRDCHRAIFDHYFVTAHAHSSNPATAHLIKGSFAAGENEFAYNDSMKVVMEAR